ncbi:MAG: bifunctional adenosylcobinamide kinase/adenosylcobinamide-phosphate guanylyltransferase [bacterium]|nr:bifunctional adenosylcobinamide kinase/adenosylcobinamide-phosphate guanylyltransferase [bacterium]
MELIIGGCFQGKSAFARTRYQELTKTVCSQEKWFSMAADGREDAWEAAWTAPAVEHVQQYIRRISLDEGTMEEKKQRISQWMETMREKNPQAILVMDEVGCGVVPMEKVERDYRDLAGYAGQCAAKEAERVYRVFCGIGRRIK